MSWRLDKVQKMIDCLKDLDISGENDFDLRTFQISNKCGTTACALGWFIIKYPNELYINTTELCDAPFWGALDYFINEPTFQEETLFEAIFGLNIYASMDLYGPDLCSVSKEEVIQQLRKLL